MKLKKHRTAKLGPGYYNYRGYNIVACGPRRWTICAEDDSVAAETKTLRAMKRKCDQWERRSNPAISHAANDAGRSP